MKKIFTLAFGLMLTVAMFAADRKPTVTVTTARKYEILIDGKRIQSDYGSTISISSLFNGRHDVKVYSMKPSFFMRSKKLVASSSFQLRNNDVQITIDRFGQIQIAESRSGRDRNDRNWNDRDSDKGNDHNYDHNYGHDKKDNDKRDRRF